MLLFGILIVSTASPCDTAVMRAMRAESAPLARCACASPSSEVHADGATALFEVRGVDGAGSASPDVAVLSYTMSPRVVRCLIGVLPAVVGSAGGTACAESRVGVRFSLVSGRMSVGLWPSGELEPLMMPPGLCADEVAPAAVEAAGRGALRQPPTERRGASGIRPLGPSLLVVGGLVAGAGYGMSQASRRDECVGFVCVPSTMQLVGLLLLAQGLAAFVTGGVFTLVDARAARPEAM